MDRRPFHYALILDVRTFRDSNALSRRAQGTCRINVGGMAHGPLLFTARRV
jgi:hypothetical protein